MYSVSCQLECLLIARDHSSFYIAQASL